MILYDSHANGLFWDFVGNFDLVGVGLEPTKEKIIGIF